MLNLNKVTLQYSPHEDRILMSGEHDGGDPVAFLLTMRMSRSIVGMLCTHLDRITPEKPVLGRDMQMACRQRDAEWQRQPAEPVRCDKGMQMFLPEKIDFSCSSGMAALIFPAGNEQAMLKMSLTELRQLLSLLHGLFLAASWPMEVWPEWLGAGEPANN